MLLVVDVSYENRRTIYGLVDACVSQCAQRKRYFSFVEQLGYDGALSYLQGLPDVNQDTLQLLVSFINGLTS